MRSEMQAKFYCPCSTYGGRGQDLKWYWISQKYLQLTIPEGSLKKRLLKPKINGVRVLWNKGYLKKAEDAMV